MKKKFSLFILAFAILFFPLIVSAHGGVEKRTGNILVTLFQTPLSPLVGEDVNFSFILTDPTASHRLIGKKARLVVTQTAYNNPTKDKIVYTKSVTSDINGTITFTYSFPTTNYYDFDLEFGKAQDEASTTGFLVQPRENMNSKIQMITIFLAASFVLNLLFVTYLIARKKS